MVRQNRRVGITLLQLLVVLVVLALFLALMLPAIQQVREAAALMQSSNNLKQMGIGIHLFHDARGMLPASVGPNQARMQGVDSTLFFAILPYVEQENLYRKGVTDVPVLFYQAENRDPTADRTQPLTSYASNISVFGDGKAPRTLAGIRKGTSNTISLVERYAVVGENTKHLWGDTKALATYIEGTKSSVEFNVTPEKAENTTAHGFARAICVVSLMDGSVQSLRSGVKATAFQWLCDPNSKAPDPGGW